MKRFLFGLSVVHTVMLLATIVHSRYHELTVRLPLWSTGPSVSVLSIDGWCWTTWYRSTPAGVDAGLHSVPHHQGRWAIRNPPPAREWICRLNSMSTGLYVVFPLWFPLALFSVWPVARMVTAAKQRKSLAPAGDSLADRISQDRLSTAGHDEGRCHDWKST